MEYGPVQIDGPLDNKSCSPIREAVLATVTASVKAVKALSNNFPDSEYKWSDKVVNRIMRGVLWTIGNGNAPGRDFFAHSDHSGSWERSEDRSLECCLSFTHLERLERAPETVYIS